MAEDNLLDFLKIESLESSAIPTARALRRQLKLKALNRLKLQAVKDVLPELPGPGESFHIVADGKFDFWTFTPHIIGLMGGRAEQFFGSTWTLSRPNALEMLELYDAGKIGMINLLTGTYFKRRETSVYATILEGIQARGQRYVAFQNHAKVTLLGNANYYITIEGSANYCSNPRVEQYVVTNDKLIFEFHRGWMNEMLGGKNDKIV